MQKREFHVLEISAKEETSLFIKTIDKLESFDLKFRVLNGTMALKAHPEVIINVKL